MASVSELSNTPAIKWLLQEAVSTILRLESLDGSADHFLSDEPDTVDEKFVKILQTCFELHSYQILGEMGLQNSILTVGGVDCARFEAVEKMINLIQTLRDLQARIRANLEKCIPGLDREPRIVR